MESDRSLHRENQRLLVEEHENTVKQIRKYIQGILPHGIDVNYMGLDKIFEDKNIACVEKLVGTQPEIKLKLGKADQLYFYREDSKYQTSNMPKKHAVPSVDDVNAAVQVFVHAGLLELAISLLGAIASVTPDGAPSLEHYLETALQLLEEPKCALPDEVLQIFEIKYKSTFFNGVFEIFLRNWIDKNDPIMLIEEQNPAEVKCWVEILNRVDLNSEYLTLDCMPQHLFDKKKAVGYLLKNLTMFEVFWDVEPSMGLFMACVLSDSAIQQKAGSITGLLQCTVKLLKKRLPSSIHDYCTRSILAWRNDKDFKPMISQLESLPAWHSRSAGKSGHSQTTTTTTTTSSSVQPAPQGWVTGRIPNPSQQKNSPGGTTTSSANSGHQKTSPGGTTTTTTPLASPSTNPSHPKTSPGGTTTSSTPTSASPSANPSHKNALPGGSTTSSTSSGQQPLPRRRSSDLKP